MMLEINLKMFVNSSSFTITEDFREIFCQDIISLKHLEITEEWGGTMQSLILTFEFTKIRQSGKFFFFKSSLKVFL